MAREPQGDRREHRALHTMRDTFREDGSRRITGVARRLQIVADFVVEKLLDSDRRGEAAEDLSLAAIEVLQHSSSAYRIVDILTDVVCENCG